MSSINPQTSLYLADSRTNPGTVNLPDSASFLGRTITIKDQFGSASMSTIAISTISPDTFDDGTNVKYITDNYGLYTLSAVSSNVWTVMNTSITPVVHTSTIHANTISTSSMIASSISTYSMTVQQDFYLQNYPLSISNDNLTLNGSVLMNIDQNVSTIDGLGSYYLSTTGTLFTLVGNGTTTYNPAANSLTGTANDWVLSTESYPNAFFSCKSPTPNGYFGLNSVTNTNVGYFTYAFFYNSGYLGVSQAGGAQNIGVWDSNDLLSISLTQTSTIFYRNANECARYSTILAGDYQAGFSMSAANILTDIAFAGSKSQNPINSVNFTTIPTNVVYPTNLISSIDGLGSFYQSSFSLFTSTLADPVLSLTGSGILDTYTPSVGISSGNVYIASMTGNVSWSNTPTAGDISRWVICGDLYGISSTAVLEQWQQYNFPAAITSNNTSITGYLYPQCNMNILVGLQNSLTNPGDYTAIIDSFAVQRIA